MDSRLGSSSRDTGRPKGRRVVAGLRYTRRRPLRRVAYRGVAGYLRPCEGRVSAGKRHLPGRVVSRGGRRWLQRKRNSGNLSAATRPHDRPSRRSRRRHPGVSSGSTALEPTGSACSSRVLLERVRPVLPVEDACPSQDRPGVRPHYDDDRDGGGCPDHHALARARVRVTGTREVGVRAASTCSHRLR